VYFSGAREKTWKPIVLVEQYMEDLTPQAEYDKPKLIRETNYEYRERGIGRPTKKERRIIEQLKKIK
jgi:ribosome-associated heat shock protein Hsp15